MTRKVLRLKDLITYIGLSSSAIYDRMNEKSNRHDERFPKPFGLGGKAKGWYQDDIDAWLLSCKNAPQKVGPSVARVAKTPAPTNGTTRNVKSKRKKTPGSLASLILEGGDINERVLGYLQMPSWTPAMGVLIVCGIAPQANCTEIPFEGIGLDDKPIPPASAQLLQARQMLREWTEWAEDEEKPIAEMPPGRFLYWCQDCNIDTDWLRLCLELRGFRDKTKTDLTGARFALLTSK